MVSSNTLSSIAAPPLQLVSIVGIVMFLLFVPSYIKFRSTVQAANTSFHIFRLVLPLLLILIAYFISRCGSRIKVPGALSFLGRRVRGRAETGGSPPWGVAATVVVLLVLASSLSNCRSMWSPLIWRPY